MEILRNKRFLSGTILSIAAVLFLSLNVLSGTLFKSIRLDLTNGKLYTLTKGSKEILAEIQEPIILRLYYSQSLANVNPYMASFAARVKDLLMQYQRAGKGKIVVEIIDPEPFSPAEDDAVNYGLQGAPIDSAGTEFYLGLVATDSLNARQTIPFIHPNREQNLEYDITQMVYKLVHTQPRIVGVMSSIPIEGGIYSRPWAIWQQMQQLFSLQVIDYDAKEIPNSVNTLMIIEPSTFSKDALKAIDKFVMRGGHVLAFVDPLSEVSDQSTAEQNEARQKTAGNYIDLLKAWGVDFDDEHTVADRALAKVVRVPFQGKEVNLRYPLWMDFATENLAQDDILSSAMDRLTIASPGVLQASAQATTKFVPLIATTDQAMLLEAKHVPEYQSNLQKFLNDFEPSGKYTIAARISGPIKSPYTDSSVAESNIIVVADTDMLHDHFWISVQNLMGQEFAMPSASNGNFVLSALDNLSGSNALISIRNKGTFSRPFETIRALEIKSQDKYQETEELLQQKLEATKQKLEQLEAQKKDGNSLVLSAEQRKEEESFRQDLVEVRKELREVRRNLNKDIETVATKIKFFSIALMPILIVACGLGVWLIQIKRENKSRRA